MKGEKIGEDKYTEHWSLDGHSYVEVPKWVVEQVRDEERERILKQLRKFGITAPSVQALVLNASQFEAYINAPITNNKN